MKEGTSAGTVDSEPSGLPDTGFVALLDALGTKGVWSRPEGTNFPERLHALILDARSFDPTGRGLESSFIPLGAPGEKIDATTHVAALSDTIVLTYAVSRTGPLALRLFSVCLVYLFRQALQRGILLRGAAAHGRFLASGEVFIGPAVDEAACWYDRADWAGVLATPSLATLLDDWGDPERASVPCFVPYPVPLKPIVNQRDDCSSTNELGWALGWSSTSMQRGELVSAFGSKVDSPSVQRKLANTLAFHDYWIETLNRLLGGHHQHE